MGVFFYLRVHYSIITFHVFAYLDMSKSMQKQVIENYIKILNIKI